MENHQHKERRLHKRDIFNFKIEVTSEDKKSVFKCASFDLSEGGLRIVTNTKLKENFVIVHINKQRFTAKIVHMEQRRSSVMNDLAYYYGLKFSSPMKPDHKKELVHLSQKAGFR
jgi:c-di-GMP-binding flagellar brake protein YcgR